MKQKFYKIFNFLKIIILLKLIFYIKLSESKKDLLNDIIIFENTNGDIYLSKSDFGSVLIFGTSLSNEEERIFYGLSTDEKYIFNDNGKLIPFIKKNINRSENKKISNAKMGLFELRSDIFIILIGTDDSYIEIFSIKYYSYNLNLYSNSNFFPQNTINKGISPLLYGNTGYLFFISSSKFNDDSTNFFISANKYDISIENSTIFNYILLNNNNNNFYNIKGEYMDCFAFSSNFFSCFYLDIDNNYKINIIENVESDFFERNNKTIGTISNPVDGEFYFLKGIPITSDENFIGNNDNFYAIYVYYSGSSNNIPTFLFIYIEPNNYIFSNKYNDQYPAVYLYDYPFNNGIKYNDLVLNQYNSVENLEEDFFFVSTNSDKEYLIIAYLIFFTSSSSPNDIKLSIRYYLIKLKDYFIMKIFHGFKIINFSHYNYLTLAFDFCLSEKCGSSNNGNAALMIFSYLNKTKDIDINFTEYAFNNNKEYIVSNLSEIFSIDNNIFGYQFGEWIDLIDFDIYLYDDENGINFTNGIDLEPIDETFFLFENDALLRIDFNNYNFDEPLYDNILFFISTYIVSEENLPVFNSYCDNYNDSFGDINDENSHPVVYKDSIYSKYNINMEDELSRKCNVTNCTLCLRNDSFYCIICIDDKYTIISDEIYGKRKICEILQKEENRINLDDLLNGKYKDINLSIEEIKYIYEELQSYLKEQFNGKNTIINANNVKIQMSKMDDQKNEQELSNIDLGECEDKLKSKYCKTEEDSLIILKFDIKPENEKSTFVGYEVYDPYTLSQIDLNECENSNIIMNVPIKLDPEIEKMYDLLYKSGYNLFNDESKFYNDICATYTTENGTDILLYDRRNDIYQLTINISLCQEGCKFEEYDSNTKKAKCNCPRNTNTNELNNLNLSNIKFDKNEMLDRFKEVIDNSNFRVLKCYKLLFKFNLFIKNIGSIIMTILFILFLILLVIYISSNSKRIHLYIQEIINFKNEKFQKNKINSAFVEEKINKKRNKKGKKKKKKKKKSNKSTNKSLKIEENMNQNNNNIVNSIELKKAPPKKTIKYTSENNLEGLTNSKNIINKSNNDYNESNYNIKNENEKRRKNSITNNNNNENIIDIYNKYKETIINSPDKEQNKNENLEKKGNTLSENELIKKKNDDRHISDKNLNIEDKCQISKINELNDQEINSLEYEQALELDKRTFFQYYLSLIKKKQLILFTFLPSNDYNLISLKISLFLVSFSLYLTINAFFFNDDTMHKIYKDSGAFNIIYQIPQILYSSITSSVINILLKTLSLSEKDIIKIKQEKDVENYSKKSKEIEKCIKIKFIIFFIISIILMLFFWYYISCFCAVYTNTQTILFKDTLISYALSMLYPFGLNLLPGIFRIPSLRAKNKDKKCLYSIGQIVALL